MTALRVLTVAAASLGLLLAASCDPAVAQSAQIDQLIEGPDLQGGNDPTVAERYPVTHYRYPFYGEGVGIGSRSSEMLDQTLNALASLLILGAGLLAQAASKLLQWAFDPSTTAWLLDAVEDTVTALGSSIYGQMILAVAMLGALWVAWQGLGQRRATSALQGGIWMVAVIALGAAFLSQPRWFIETPHEVTTELSATLFGAVAGVGTGSGSDGYHGESSPSFSGPAATDTQRQLEDQLWRVMVFEPWRISTFPDQQFADLYGEQLLADRSEANVEEIYEEIRAEDEQAAQFFAGREPLDRLVASGMTLLAALPIAITMLVLGAALIVLQFAFVILSLLAPVFLLVGIHPGGGRNALLRWLDMWLGTLVKRVAITALIAVLVALFAFASANLSQQGWYLTVLLTTLVCVAALVYRKTITELLASSAGTVGSGVEGEREHRGRAHPLQTTQRTAASASRTLKFMSAGALMQRAVRRGQAEENQERQQDAGAGPATRRASSRSRRPGRDPHRQATEHTTAPASSTRDDGGHTPTSSGGSRAGDTTEAAREPVRRSTTAGTSTSRRENGATPSDASPSPQGRTSAQGVADAGKPAAPPIDRRHDRPARTTSRRPSPTPRRDDIAAEHPSGPTTHGDRRQRREER